MTQNQFKVFVYGTLKKGLKYHDYIKDSIFLGEAHTGKGYSLYLGEYPCLIKEEQGQGVYGEIYQVDEHTLLRLDELEDHPELYLRSEMNIKDHGAVIYYLYIGHEKLTKISSGRF